jgi:WD40 repeat protein
MSQVGHNLRFLRSRLGLLSLLEPRRQQSMSGSSSLPRRASGSTASISLSMNVASSSSSGLQPSPAIASPPSSSPATDLSTISHHHRAISPPTPAPSPQPDARPLRPEAALPSPLSNSITPLSKQFSHDFPSLDPKQRRAFLTSLVDSCSARELAFLSSLISPRLKVDFLSSLPIEVSLQIISYMDLKSLARASGVSRFWRSLVNDEHTWKVMCDKYKFRKYAMFPNSSQSHGLDTPDRSLQSIDEYDDESPTQGEGTPYRTLRRRTISSSEGSLESSQVLSSLYEAYIARGLDPASALSELKALHNLFLSKRAKEMGVEERRRQLHALQHDSFVTQFTRDRTAIDRVSEYSMSQEDRQFYHALEEFVQEKRESANADYDATNAGWLSTGPMPSRNLGDLPQTPTAGSQVTQPTALPSVPSQHLNRSIISPTGRFGMMTSGILNSVWDRSGNQWEDGHPPSTGDHGHSTEGHTDGDTDMQIDSASDEASSRKAFSMGKGRPSWQNNRVMPVRAATLTEKGMSALGFNMGPSQNASTAAGGFGSAPKRSISSGFERSDPYRQSASRRTKPFSYKTHFKMAYLTESNWLRGGRLLTQHVSADDATGEGPVVTTLSIDDEWIVVGMANAKIHVFSAKTGLFVQTLIGHSSGVWCLSLISASGSTSESGSKGKGKQVVEDQMMEDPFWAAGMPDLDRPHYMPTPDLNLIHHDPRPTASTYSPEVSFKDLSTSEETPNLTKMPKIGEQLPSWGTSDFSDQQDEAASSRPLPKSSRGAGLGSNFGSPCGSVQGYGNPGAIVVSGGCDRDVRVWDLSTGVCKYVLSGHRSTVRCLRVLEERPIAISGARDGTLRVWNVETGTLIHTLAGHQHSVRCLDVAGNMVASASYDCSCRVWNVDTGECVHVLRGHYHQIYAVAFDGVRIATGSLDSTVRVWSAQTGECLALFQGHTSLVGQLQLTDSTLITGGSDGKVIIFSLKSYKMLCQLMAHDNSVTCLQFDDRFIVTGGNDGKVKLWNFKTGEFVRELCDQSDQVWKVSFRDDKCVVLCKRKDKTAMDVISFRPIEEAA